jgi:hypothetical protein
MDVPAGTVVKITNANLNRCYFAVQNFDSTATNFVYLLQQEAEPEVFTNTGLAVGGYGLFEMQNCLNAKSKSAWYAYTAVVGGVNIRVVDI